MDRHGVKYFAVFWGLSLLEARAYLYGENYWPLLLPLTSTERGRIQTFVKYYRFFLFFLPLNNFVNYVKYKIVCIISHAFVNQMKYVCPPPPTDRDGGQIELFLVRIPSVSALT